MAFSEFILKRQKNLRDFLQISRQLSIFLPISGEASHPPRGSDLGRGRAFAGLDRGPRPADDVLHKLHDLFPPRPEDDHKPGPDPEHRLAPDIRRRIVAVVSHVIKTLPRRSGPGPTGSRFQHWMTLRDSNESIGLAAEFVIRLIEWRAPPEIIDANLSAQLAGHPEPNGPDGMRLLVIGGVLRRIALKAVWFAFSGDLRDASGPMQFAIARPGGPELMHKFPLSWVRLRPGAIVLKLDFRNL